MAMQQPTACLQAVRMSRLYQAFFPVWSVGLRTPRRAIQNWPTTRYPRYPRWPFRFQLGEGRALGPKTRIRTGDKGPRPLRGMKTRTAALAPLGERVSREAGRVRGSRGIFETDGFFAIVVRFLPRLAAPRTRARSSAASPQPESLIGGGVASIMPMKLKDIPALLVSAPSLAPSRAEAAIRSARPGTVRYRTRRSWHRPLTPKVAASRSPARSSFCDKLTA